MKNTVRELEEELLRVVRKWRKARRNGIAEGNCYEEFFLLLRALKMHSRQWRKRIPKGEILTLEAFLGGRKIPWLQK
ncbi:MAG: hypothetical protein PHS95_00715 [Candidatus Pacebacteria bacterium]|nr:hypothetical protein [Candidatus Paceibacterota bacterium]